MSERTRLIPCAVTDETVDRWYEQFEKSHSWPRRVE